MTECVQEPCILQDRTFFWYFHIINRLSKVNSHVFFLEDQIYLKGQPIQNQISLAPVVIKIYKKMFHAYSSSFRQLRRH